MRIKANPLKHVVIYLSKETCTLIALKFFFCIKRYIFCNIFVQIFFI